MRSAATILCAVALVACGGGDQSSAPTPTTSPPATTPGTAPTAPTATTPSTVPPAATPTTPPPDADATTTERPSAPATLPPYEPPAGTDLSFLVVDGDGVHRDGVLVVAGAIAWADDDEMDGIVYRLDGEDSTIRWLPAGADQPIDTGFRRGVVGATGTGPALVTPDDAPTGDQCGEIVGNGEVHAVNARPLDASTELGSPQLVTCSHEGADDWYATVSYRNGHLARVHSYAAGSKYTDDEIVLTGPDGEQIELPANTFAGWVGWFEQQRELDAGLSSDASLMAVRQRLDNRYSNGPDPETGEVDVEEWERLTAAIPSTIRVVELATGTIRYETQVPYGVELGDFDGRHVVLLDAAQSTIVDTLGETPPTTIAGTVVFTRPIADSPETVPPAAAPVTVRHGDTGPWVSHLQLRLLVHDPSAGLTVDGQFGPATDAAVTTFQRRHGLEPDGIAGPNTWTALLSAPGELSIVPDELPIVPDEELAILRAGGIATVDVGAPADETLTALTLLLGPPSRDVAIDLAARECVEGSDWADCASVVAVGRILTWDDLGLDVLLTDHDVTSPTAATALHFGGWRLRAGAADTSEATLATTDGLRIGSLLGDVRRVHPGVELYNNEGVYDTFAVYPGGRLAGELGLMWSEQVRMVQNAFVARGADIAVDGELGPATLAAWDAFVAAEGLTGETGFPSIGLLAALGITFDELPVTELWSA